MRQSHGQGTRAAYTLMPLLTLCLACETPQLNDPDMLGADEKMYEAARMEHPVPRTPKSPRDNLATAPNAPEDEVIRRRRAKHWEKQCRVQRPCPALHPLPKCNPSPAKLSPFASSPEELLPGEVKLRGALFISPISTTAVGCHEFPLLGCCNAVGGEALLLIGEASVNLDRLGCWGDNSGMCCDVPASGQDVVVSGMLTYEEWGETLLIEKPQICVDQ